MGKIVTFISAGGFTFIAMWCLLGIINLNFKKKEKSLNNENSK